MQRKAGFEIVDVSNEYMAIPVGEMARDYKGIVVLSEPAAFLLRHMDAQTTESELCMLLQQEYEVDSSVAVADVKRIIATFYDIGLIER